MCVEGDVLLRPSGALQVEVLVMSLLVLINIIISCVSKHTPGVQLRPVLHAESFILTLTSL